METERGGDRHIWKIFNLNTFNPSKLGLFIFLSENAPLSKWVLEYAKSANNLSWYGYTSETSHLEAEKSRTLSYFEWKPCFLHFILTLSADKVVIILQPTVYFLLHAVGCKFILYITSCFEVNCDLTVWWAVMIYFWRFFHRGRVFNLISNSWTGWEWYFEERTNMIQLFVY